MAPMDLRLSAAAMTAALVVAACAASPPRTPDERLADEQIDAQVLRALGSDQDLFARHIDVDTERGVVYLSGYVWAANDLYEARRVAATVPGVRKVVNQMDLVIGGRAGSR